MIRSAQAIYVDTGAWMAESQVARQMGLSRDDHEPSQILLARSKRLFDTAFGRHVLYSVERALSGLRGR